MRMCSCIGSTGQRPEHPSQRDSAVKHVDAARFVQQAGGNPALMARIAQAFVGQLPEWRTEFAAAKPNRAPLAALLHKMKGSCHAISATGAAEAFAKAELALQVPDFKADAELEHLLVLVAEIETDLKALINQAQAPCGPAA